MCTVLLPPGDNPIAVNKYINISQADYLAGKREFLECRKNDYRQSLFLSISFYQEI